MLKQLYSVGNASGIHGFGGLESSGDGLVTCNKRKIPCPFRLLADRLCTSDNSYYPDASTELVLLNFGHYRRHVGMNNANRSLQLVSQSGRYLYHAQTSSNIKITSEFPTACFESH